MLHYVKSIILFGLFIQNNIAYTSSFHFNVLLLAKGHTVPVSSMYKIKANVGPSSVPFQVWITELLSVSVSVPVKWS